MDLEAVRIEEAVKLLVGHIQAGDERALVAADDLKQLVAWHGRDLPFGDQDLEILAGIAFKGAVDARAVAVMDILRAAGQEEARVLERALGALQSAGGTVDAALVGVIGRVSMDDVRIDTTLRSALASREPAVAGEAIRAIGEARPRLQRDTLLVLVDLVRGETASLRGGALVALESLGDRAALAGDALWSVVLESDVERLPTVLRTYSAIAEDAPARMLRYVSSPDVRVRVTAIRGLVSRGRLTAEGEAVLIAGLGDAHADIRLACLATLMLGEPHTERAIVETVKYLTALWDSIVREGRHPRRDAELLTALMHAARHPIRDVRIQMALGAIVASTRHGNPSDFGSLGDDLRAEAPWAWWRAGADDQEATLAIVASLRGLEGEPGQVKALERIAAILNEGGQERTHPARAAVIAALVESGALDPSGQLRRAPLSAAARELIAETVSAPARSER